MNYLYLMVLFKAQKTDHTLEMPEELYNFRKLFLKLGL